MPEDVAAWLKLDASIALVRRTEDKSDGDRGGQWWQTRIAAAEEDNSGRRGQQWQKGTTVAEEDNGSGREQEWRAVENGGGEWQQRTRAEDEGGKCKEGSGQG